MTKRNLARWAPLLIVAGIVAACGPAVTPTADAPAPAPVPAPTPAPQEPLATCGDSAIRLLGRGAGIHGAIVADTLHMGGAATPVTCTEPANLALLARLSIPDDYTAQVQQSQYYLIVIRYPDGNRLYVISRRSDGTSCVVDTNDQCIAQVTELPDGFDLDNLPEDVAPTIPGGRPAPAPPAATDTAPAAAADPQPRDGATGVAVETLLLSWSAADRAASYDVYWGREEHLAADTDLGTPIATTSTAMTIRRPGATAAERRLALGTTYYWRVDAKNDQGTTTGSVWSFTTRNAPAPPPAEEDPPPATGPPPGAASNPQPRDGATGVTTYGPVLYWDEAPRAFTYTVYVGTSHDLAGDISTRAEGRGAGWTKLSWVVGRADTVGLYRPSIFGLWVVYFSNETTYYWRVDANNEDGTTTRGEVWSFTTVKSTGKLPGVASLPRPRDGATNVIGRSFRHGTVGHLQLLWEYAPRARFYFVYVGTSSDLSTDNILGSPFELNALWRGVAWSSGHVVQFDQDFSPLSHGTTYYWRVDAKNEDGITRGNVWSFTTGTCDTSPLRYCRPYY